MRVAAIYEADRTIGTDGIPAVLSGPALRALDCITRLWEKDSAEWMGNRYPKWMVD